MARGGVFRFAAGGCGNSEGGKASSKVDGSATMATDSDAGGSGDSGGSSSTGGSGNGGTESALDCTGEWGAPTAVFVRQTRTIGSISLTSDELDVY